MTQSEKYHLFRLGGRVVIAWPGGGRGGGAHSIRNRAIACFPGSTLKRRAVRRLLQLAVGLGLDSLIAGTTSDPVAEPASFDFHAWLKRTGEALEQTEPLQAAIIWPPQPDRGRIYVHLLNESGDVIGFAKVSLNETNDTPIANEARMLQTLTGEDHSTFRTPRVMAEFEYDGRATVIVKPLPAQAHHVTSEMASYPSEAIESFAGATQSMSVPEIKHARWWSHLTHHETGELPLIAREILEYAERFGGLAVCRVHGDLGPGNLMRTPTGELWIIDWEGAGVGPRLTDSVNFHLALNQALILNDPEAGMKHVLDHWLTGPQKEPKAELAAALAYLASVGIQAAEVLVERWDRRVDGERD